MDNEETVLLIQDAGNEALIRALAEKLLERDIEHTVITTGLTRLIPTGILVRASDLAPAKAIVDAFLRNADQNPALRAQNQKYRQADPPERRLLRLFHTLRPIHVLVALALLLTALALALAFILLRQG